MSKSKFDPQKHHRRSIRLKGYDYSSEGAYYVTIVTWHRDCIFGEVVNQETPQGSYVVLSDLGKIADECWRAIPAHFPFVELGAHVVMPNHVHGIIWIMDERRGEVPSPRVNPNKNILDEGADQISNEGEVPSPHYNPNKNILDEGADQITTQGGETSIYGDGTNDLGGETPPLRKPTLGQIVAYFKYQSTKEMNRIETDKAITKFWQRNYYEHIIRDEEDLQNKTDYIHANPSLWDEDDNNPRNVQTP